MWVNQLEDVKDNLKSIINKIDSQIEKNIF